MNARPRKWLLRAAPIAWCIIIFALSAQSDPPGGGILDFIPFADKIAHFFLYAILGWLAMSALKYEKTAALARHAFLIAVIFCALYGITDEYHQSFVPGRIPDVMDWTADTLGGVVGCAIYSWFLRG